MTAPLSVCCLTADAPEAVALSLAPLRSIADEILVAVDDRVDPTALGPLRAIADRVWTVEFRDPPELVRPWLVEQCRGRWVLVLDGDEVPSSALVRALPAVLARDDVLDVRIARRWLFPSANAWLAETPWWPDLQTRLVRRDEPLCFDLGFHGGLLPREPAQLLVEPIYHLNLLVRSLAQRLGRADVYERAGPRRAAPGGGGFNRTFYAPEEAMTMPPSPTPDEDRALLARVVDAHRAGTPMRAPLSVSAAVPSAGTASLVAAGAMAEGAADGFDRVPHVGSDALLRVGSDALLRVAQRAAAPPLHVTIRPIEPDLRFAPGETRSLLVEIENRGPLRIGGAGAQPEVRLAYHLYDSAGAVVVHDGLRTALPAALRPGERTIAAVHVMAPPAPGRYRLYVDVVHERVRWLEQGVWVDMLCAERWQRHLVGGDPP